MGSVHKYNGFVTCIARIITAACILGMGYSLDGAYLWYTILALNVLALYAAMCIRKSSTFCGYGRVEYRELHKIEAKNCARKAYIYLAIITQNILWLFGFFEYFDDIRYAFFTPEPLIPSLILLYLLMDIAYIKFKNFRYACRSHVMEG